MSPQIISLKVRTDFSDPTKFWPPRLFAFELRREERQPGQLHRRERRSCRDIEPSVPLVRQDGQRVKLDPLLVQLLGLVRRGLAVDRTVLDLAVVHLARLFRKSPPNIIGVSDEMF